MQPRAIEQTGEQLFVITWRDGLKMEYDLPSIQKVCPCARCREGKRDVQNDVQIRSIESVGRYALRFAFLGGCDRGVYTYSLLRRIGRLLKTP